jgi:hypothetical protein
MVGMPLPVNTSSNAGANLLSRSPDQESEVAGALAEIHEQVAGLLGVWVPKTMSPHATWAYS